MRAIQVAEINGPLQLVELPDPTPGPGQVAIDVAYASVGLIDSLFRRPPLASFVQMPFVPGLEVSGTVRALGAGVTNVAVGERVVSFAGTGTGGYAEIFVGDARRVFRCDSDLAIAVATIPNAAMAHVALSHIARAGESLLVRGAFGAFASVFPGIAKQLGVARVVGTSRTPRATRLPYDEVVAETSEAFDVVVDPVGGTRLDALKPFGRMLLVGNASEDWTVAIDRNELWLRCITVSGFNAGAYLPAHMDELPGAVAAAQRVLAAGLLDVDLARLPLADAAHADPKRRTVLDMNA